MKNDDLSIPGYSSYTPSFTSDGTDHMQSIDDFLRGLNKPREIRYISLPACNSGPVVSIDVHGLIDD